MPSKSERKYLPRRRVNGCFYSTTMLCSFGQKKKIGKTLEFSTQFQSWPSELQLFASLRHHLLLRASSQLTRNSHLTGG